MIGGGDFDATFRQAMAEAIDPPVRLEFAAFCAQHPDRAMRPLPGQEAPSNPLPATYRVRVACSECGREVVLGFKTIEEASTS